MRYTQESNPPSLSLESHHHQPQLLSIYPPTTLTSAAPYTHDPNTYYQTNHHVFNTGPVDYRSRLGSHASNQQAWPPTLECVCWTNIPPSSASLTGMAHSHTHRNTPLPLPSHHHISTRDQYAAATPGFRRPSEHPTRPPLSPGSAFRRSHLSPASSSLNSFTSSAGRMDGSPYSNRAPSAQSLPPLQPTQTFGSLNYTNSDGNTTLAKVDISGSIDKGFFLSDGEWTCYRRNYFACVCSYSLTPTYQGVPLHYTPADTSQQPLQVFGFAMCISAVVAENDQQGIELVQHTPKRDKGPVASPGKVPLAPKQAMTGSHALSLYPDAPGAGATSRMYDGFSGSQGGQIPQTEHTFERIQFKQATQNNGKRRAAQQYYHLVIELWADAGSGRDQYVRVAVRKSAKMIVRGRSPGHYQNDRRSSQSSGPGGSSGNMIGYPMNNVGDMISGSLTGNGGNNFGGDSRGSLYGARHHELPAEILMSSEDEKQIESTKGYSYFPYANGSLERIDMYSQRHDAELAVSHPSSGGEISYNKGPTEVDAKYFVPSHRCAPFDRESTSKGYYPTGFSPPGANISMT